MNKHKRLALSLTAILLSVLTLSSCSLLGIGKDKDSEFDVPNLSQPNPNSPKALATNAQGLTEVEEKIKVFASDKLTRLETAMNNFGARMPEYLPKVKEDALAVSDFEAYRKSRAELEKACAAIEALPLSQVPANMKNLCDNLFFMANTARAMLYDVHHVNGTNLPDSFNRAKQQNDQRGNMLKNFFNQLNGGGIASAVPLITPIDWNAEEAKSPQILDTFNVFDLSLPWGASKGQVMGVEGPIRDADTKSDLSYRTKVYLYQGTRTYHFNEHGQLDSVFYQLTPHNENPVNDVAAVSPRVMRDFVNDISIVKQPVQQSDGTFSITFDLKSESVIIFSSAQAGTPLRVNVTGKRAAKK